MSEVACPRCKRAIRDVEEEFENEVSAEADVDGECPHCGSKLRFSRRVEYDVKSAD